LTGGHSFGRCHAEISGYSGPWTSTPGFFSNEYAKKLVTEEWKLVDSTMTDYSGDLITGVKPYGMRRQYVNKNGKGELMMLVSDLALYKDPVFGKEVEYYAKDFNALKKDWGEVFHAGCMLNFDPPKRKTGISKCIFECRVFRVDFAMHVDNCCSAMCGEFWDGRVPTATGPVKLADDVPKVGKPIKYSEVNKHNTKADIWVAINGKVVDLTTFIDEHPGGVQAMMNYAGKDATAEWNTIHRPDTIERVAPQVIIGYIA